MAVLIANKYALPSGAPSGGNQDMVSGSWGEVAGVLTGPTNGTINAATSLRMQVGGVEAMFIDANKALNLNSTTGLFKTNSVTTTQEALITLSDGMLWHNSTLGTFKIRSAGSTFFFGANSRVSDGTAAAPSRAYSADGNTGTFRPTTDNWAVSTNGAEAMRIDSSQNVLMGKTATGADNKGAEWDEVNNRFLSTTDGNNQALFGKATSGTYSGNVLQLQTTRTVTSGAFNFITCHANDGVDLRFNVQANGDATNSNNSYGAISDRSLKENIRDTGLKLDRIMKVGIKDFNFIGDKLDQTGVIAQELEKIFPGMVTIGKNKKRSVKYSVFTPLLIKAFQEYVIKTDARLAKAGIA